MKLGAVSDIPTFVGHYWLTGIARGAEPDGGGARLRRRQVRGRWSDTGGRAKTGCPTATSCSPAEGADMSKLDEYMARRQAIALAEAAIAKAAGPRPTGWRRWPVVLMTRFEVRTDLPRGISICLMTPDRRRDAGGGRIARAGFPASPARQLVAGERRSCGARPRVRTRLRDDRSGRQFGRTVRPIRRLLPADHCRAVRHRGGSQ